jgi:hypothetical protein
MTQEKMNQLFKGSLGSQCLSLFTTVDDMVFVRRLDALWHLEYERPDLIGTEITEWWDTSDEEEPED